MPLLTAAEYFVVGAAWAACLADAERYGAALMLSVPVLFVLNLVVFAVAFPLICAAARRLRHPLAVAGAGIALVVAAAFYAEVGTVYFYWAEPDQLAECVDHVPRWWPSWTRG
ncbi:hypothetical protein SAMN05216215_1002259 [Saccharopolyspora shandongensis]|uniref:Uncharacterized protein n=1 Tax=Saccharopolyspora shandongensis TaxID=418495 RepID=A0A1H2SLZ9_9PSEU|nr:hypothetical protein SAMN05216215_1002259 [Saccharopolyspora shandongensis]